MRYLHTLDSRQVNELLKENRKDIEPTDSKKTTYSPPVSSKNNEQKA